MNVSRFDSPPTIETAAAALMCFHWGVMDRKPAELAPGVFVMEDGLVLSNERNLLRRAITLGFAGVVLFLPAHFIGAWLADRLPSGSLITYAVMFVPHILLLTGAIVTGLVSPSVRLGAFSGLVSLLGAAALLIGALGYFGMGGGCKTEPVFFLCLLIESPFVALGARWSIGSAQRALRAPPASGERDCVNCGYNLKGLPERRCPECGTPF